MTKANKTNAVAVTTANPFAGMSAKTVREEALAGRIDRGQALAYAVAKQAELAGHKFRGQLWADTVRVLSGGKATSARKAKPAAELTKADILAQIQALTAALASAK